jgi:hypothetical protein
MTEASSASVKPPPDPDLVAAENVVADLDRKRAAHLQRGRELSDERASIALAAHSGDSKASKRLMEINAALALHSSELEGLDVAAEAAGKQVAAARAAAAAGMDWSRLYARDVARPTATS